MTLRDLNQMSNEMVLAVSVIVSIALFVVFVTVLHRVI